jgi:hypothetical protein
MAVTDPVKAKKRRFGALKAHGKKLQKVKQDKWDAELVGEGMCAAVAMQWIGFDYGYLAMPSEEILKPLADVQRAYVENMRGKRWQEATKDLAEGMMLTLAPPSLYCSPLARADEAATFWSKRGYSSEKLSDKIVVLTGKLREGLESGGRTAVFLSFKIDVESIGRRPWETLRNYTPKQLGGINIDGLAKFVASWEPRQHGIALVVREENITLCDANCGIYEIEWGKAGDFFTEYEKPYRSILKKNDDPPNLVYKTGLTSIQGIVPG